VAYIATKHLLDLGHERIADVTHRWSYSSESHRGSAHEAGILGYSAAMAERGLEAAQRFHFVEGNPERWESIEDLFVDAATRPTGVVCHMDFAATHVIRACRERGLRVPEDVAVVGANNTPWCEWSEVPLTSVSLREDLIARSAAQLLGSASKSPAQIVMEPEVVIRESCGHRLASARPTRGRSGGRNK
jgi:DNA-binding LacI/PurR family transcriptional regulator